MIFMILDFLKISEGRIRLWLSLKYSVLQSKTQLPVVHCHIWLPSMSPVSQLLPASVGQSHMLLNTNQFQHIISTLKPISAVDGWIPQENTVTESPIFPPCDSVLILIEFMHSQTCIFLSDCYPSYSSSSFQD